jgi:hypothetical protein
MPRMHRVTVDLPHPDSPTRPSVSPGWMSNETPSTARTGGPDDLPRNPFLGGNTFVRSRTSNNGSTLLRATAFSDMGYSPGDAPTNCRYGIL